MYELGKVSHFFMPITKRNDEQRLAYGYASTEAKDFDGEVITLDAMRGALPDYYKFANIREMHQMSAVGIAKEASVDDKGLYIAAKIVDDPAWEKVKEGVYKGFSIGGRVTARDPHDMSKITGLELIEISVVDRPANPEALIDKTATAMKYCSIFKREDTRAQQVELARAVLNHAITQLGDDEALVTASQLRKRADIKLPSDEELIAKRKTEKEVIDKDGPPSADGGSSKAVNTNTEVKVTLKALETLGPPDAKAGFRKGLATACSAIWLLRDLDMIKRKLTAEAAVEGDNSTMPGRFGTLVGTLSDAVKALLEEEVGEMLSGQNYDADYSSMPYPSCVAYADQAMDAVKTFGDAKYIGEELGKAIGSDETKPGFKNLKQLAVDIGKADVARPSENADAAEKRSMIEKVQSIHDQCVGMGATCTAAKAADAKDSDGKQPGDADADDETKKAAADAAAKDATEKAAKEAADKDAAEKAAKEVTEKAALEATEKAAKEAADKDALEKAIKAKDPAAANTDEKRDPPKPGSDGKDGDEDDAAKKKGAEADKTAALETQVVDLLKGITTLAQEFNAFKAQVTAGRRDPPFPPGTNNASVIDKAADSSAVDTTEKALDPKDPDYAKKTLASVLRNPQVLRTR